MTLKPVIFVSWFSALYPVEIEYVTIFSIDYEIFFHTFFVFQGYRSKLFLKGKMIDARLQFQHVDRSFSSFISPASKFKSWANNKKKICGNIRTFHCQSLIIPTTKSNRIVEIVSSEFLSSGQNDSIATAFRNSIWSVALVSLFLISERNFYSEQFVYC